MIYEESCRAGLGDVEAGNLLKNRTILKFFEDAAANISNTLGFGPKDILRSRCTWILLEWKLQVNERPPADAPFLVRTWVRENQRIYVYRDFELLYNGRVCAVASSKWVYLNIDNGRAERMTPERIERYGIHPHSVLEGDILHRLHEPEEYERETELSIRRSHIDLNGHTHNLFYLDFAMDALPPQVFSQASPTQIRISYKKETRLGDRITCLYACSNGEHIISVKSGDTLHAMIVLA